MVIEALRKWINTLYIDNLSAKAFVSHSTNVKKADLERIDLLPKIKNKLFLTAELSPTYNRQGLLASHMIRLQQHQLQDFYKFLTN